MSVIVSELVKVYGAQRAVDGISFEAQKGQALGFLGPNGAGKTTTMKILTTFIPQTGGAASVCGFDVEKEPMEVRRRVGYLPESNPLYQDMYVREYLEFVARAHKMGSNKKTRINDMLEATGLTPESKKKIAQLSKGYKQRVGLAQAMLHDPEVLILDEPTSGLDPNQLLEIRALIKSLAKEKTVILSTHIMQEVEAMCDRVVIISKGKLVANDTPANLQQRASGNDTVRVEFKEKVTGEMLKKINGVNNVIQDNDGWLVYSDAGNDVREAVFLFSKEKNLTLLTLHKEASRMEEVFKNLTT